MSELRVLIDETEIGSLSQDKGGKLRFVYDSGWRAREDAIPLSLSMPLTGTQFGQKTVTPFLWNLLPDREATLRQIAEEHDISARIRSRWWARAARICRERCRIVPAEEDTALKEARARGADQRKPAA